MLAMKTAAVLAGAMSLVLVVACSTSSAPKSDAGNTDGATVLADGAGKADTVLPVETGPVAKDDAAVPDAYVTTDAVDAPGADAYTAKDSAEAAPSDAGRDFSGDTGAGDRGVDAPAALADAAAASDGGTDGGASAFLHPGLLHTQADFDRMKEKVAADASPWSDGWKMLTANNHASLTWNPNPQTEIHRNDGTNSDNSMTFANDVAAAYACALRWKVSGDTKYADKAIQIMNAWSSALTKITWSDGHYDGYLVAGIQGFQFANAAEIMRDYSGWAGADFARFKTMMLDVFYPMDSGMLTGAPSRLLVYSNWDLCAMAATLAIGVLCDDRAKFDSVINYFKNGLGNGALAQTVYYVHPGYLGQTQESGRDQGHNTLSISLLTTLAEMAWNQGVDLYGYDNNRILAGAEYVAKGNLIESGTAYYTMPFATYTNGSVVDTVFSTAGQGNVRPEWALIYNHYVNRMGLAAPYSKTFMLLVQPEGGGGNYGPNSGGYDQLGYGTLTHTRDAIASGAPPSGLTAYVTQGNVVLSWWGSAYATGYTLKRGETPGGPYTAVATGIVDPLTYTDQGLASGTYYYVVTATAPTGETASNEAKAIVGTTLHTGLTFDATSGTTAADSSGNGHAAALSGGASWAAGKNGNAVVLDGSSGYVSLPGDIMADIADYTISAWVYWKTSSNSQRIFDFGNGTGHYMMLTPRDGAGVVRFAITTNLRVGEQSIKGTAALPTGKWVRVAVTLSGTVGTLYVDGVVVGSNTAMQLAPFRIGHTNQNCLGRSQYSADPYFNGSIDDFRIYEGALSAAEISAL
jgi:hypothetical protein